jgi:hypothetical protein
VNRWPDRSNNKPSPVRRFDMKIEELAAELIELCCGAHSVGMLYRFLLKLNNHTEATAREEFVKFLAGELSDRLLDDARQWVAAEQACRGDRTYEKCRCSVAPPIEVSQGSLTMNSLPAVRQKLHLSSCPDFRAGSVGPGGR